MFSCPSLLPIYIIRQDKGVESIGGGKVAFIGNHGTTWVPVDWNVSRSLDPLVL